MLATLTATPTESTWVTKRAHSRVVSREQAWAHTMVVESEFVLDHSWAPESVYKKVASLGLEKARKRVSMLALKLADSSAKTWVEKKVQSTVAELVCLLASS